jgi:hypothetical protein
VKLTLVGLPDGSLQRVLHELIRQEVVSSYLTVSPDSSVGDLVQAARESDALVATACDPGTETRVPLAAIAARRHAVVPSWSARDHGDHLELDGDACDAGITLITGASASPAIPMVLARHAALGLDEVRTVEVAWALPPGVLGRDDTARAVLEGSARPALARRDGRFIYGRPGRPAFIAFPDPVGICKAGAFGGAEAWRLGDALPGNPSVRVLLGGTAAWWPAALIPAALLWRYRATEAASALGRMVARLSVQGWAGVRVEVEGSLNKASVTRVRGGFDQLSSWNAAALALGIGALTLPLKPGVAVAGSTAASKDDLRTFDAFGSRFAAFDAAV